MSEKTSFFALNRTHSDVALDLIRIFLGIVLFVRGVLFISDSSRIIALVQTGDMDYLLPSILLQIAILAHLGGGLMLAFGLLTKFAALVQIPVVAGAVYFAIVQGGLFMPNQSLELSALVLFIRGILLMSGSGPYSLDFLIFVRGITAEAEQRKREAAQRHQQKVADWERQRLEAAAEFEASKSVATRSGKARAHVGIGTIGRYAAMFIGGGVLLVFGLKSLPTAVTMQEVGAIAILFFLILGFFFLFFGWALRD